jgi:hypothetical protein
MAKFFNPLQLLKTAVVLIAVYLFYNIPLESIEAAEPLCFWKRYFDTECISCGTTRAIWCVLHLDFNKALEYNKIAVIVTFPLILLLIAAWIFIGEKRVLYAYMRLLDLQPEPRTKL